MKLRTFLLLSSTSALLLAGCAPHQSYRTDYTLCSAPDPVYMANCYSSGYW
jgi:hypothetical protein